VHRRLRRRAAVELPFSRGLRPFAHLLSIAAGLRSWTLRVQPRRLVPVPR
jgi:hypothetical protein